MSDLDSVTYDLLKRAASAPGGRLELSRLNWIRYEREIRYLHSLGYIEAPPLFGEWSEEVFPIIFADRGIHALHLFEGQRQREREERARHEAMALSAQRQKNKDYRHDFAVAFFGGIVTLAVEHFSEIVQFFQSLSNR